MQLFVTSPRLPPTVHGLPFALLVPTGLAQWLFAVTSGVAEAAGSGIDRGQLGWATGVCALGLVLFVSGRRTLS